MEIKHLPKSWILDEIKLQQEKIKTLKKYDHFKDISGFKELIEMREQFLVIAKQKLDSLNP